MKIDMNKVLVGVKENKKFEIATATGFIAGIAARGIFRKKSKKTGIPEGFEDDYRCMRILTDAEAQ